MAKDYKLIWAIKAISQIVYGFADAHSFDKNPYIQDLGVDIDGEYSRYYDCLWSLCEKVIELNMVDDVRSELQSEGFDDYAFNGIIEEIGYSNEAQAQEDLMYSVEEGDRVRLYNGEVYYVDSIDGNSIWVTKRRGDSEGWSADLSDVEDIIEKYEG